MKVVFFLAGIVGLEPAKRESKSRVLPLHHIPIRYYYMPYIGFCQYIMFRRGCQYKDLPGGAGCSFRHLISAPGIRQLLLRRAGRLMTRFFRASRRFFRGARRLCRYVRFYGFDVVYILTKSACCVTI